VRIFLFANFFSENKIFGLFAYYGHEMFYARGREGSPDFLLRVFSGLLEIGQALLDVLVVRADLLLVKPGLGLKTNSSHKKSKEKYNSGHCPRIPRQNVRM
jgi:hypothetical protein